jgi:hypothetical protein
MKCEEFDASGFDVSQGALANTPASAAALEHLNSCPRCAALRESWQQARISLHALGQATRQAAAPARVEMRIQQEFRTKYATGKTRGRLIFAAWTLATAAILVLFVSWWNWRLENNRAKDSAASSVPKLTPDPGPLGNVNSNSEPDTGVSDAVLVADNAGDFTLLPGSLPQETQDAAILRVRLQRGALGAMGLPVNQERAADWIQVDLLVGEDGQPRAVRLPASESD